MKKALYGTTALVAAGALMSFPANAQEGIKLGLGGYMDMFFGFGSTDNDLAGGADRGATNVFQDGEIWFTGETTLDNGLSFGANVQLEAFSPGDQVDESFGYIEGNFGRINIGSENTAAYLMGYTAPGVGVPVNSGWITTFIPNDGVHISQVVSFRTPIFSTSVDMGTIGNDERVITYFTPRFSGLQVGVSWTPAFSGTGDGQVTAADTDSQFNNGISLGVNYVQTLGGVDVAVSGGYLRAEAPDVGGLDDEEEVMVGANFGFAGFTVGGSYAQHDGDLLEAWSWDFGATYSTGPWTVGATYFHSASDELLSVNIEDEVDAISGGISYAVGPGITASAGLIYADLDAEFGADADGTVGYVGLKYNF